MKITKLQLKQIIEEEIKESHKMAGAGGYMGMGAAYKRDDEDSLDEVEEVDLAQLEPTVAKIAKDVELQIERELDRLPEASRQTVRQAIIAKLGYEDGSLEEVSSEKQRRWACAQKDKTASERPESLSSAEADEMCKSKIEEDD